MVKTTKNRVTKGKLVSISYLIRDQHNQIVEYSDLPVTYPHGGEHDLFPQIEQALDGKTTGGPGCGPD